MKNESKIYANGKKFMTSNGGEVEIVGKVDKSHFLVVFEDGTIIMAQNSAIRTGRVKNPNVPSVLGVGYLGVGNHLASKGCKDTKEYKLWHRMLQRAYDKKFHKNHPTYKDVIVDKKWLNFNTFCSDITKLYNYKEWNEDTNKRNNYELDKDIRVEGNKVYGRDTCMFVTQAQNLQFSNVTGKTYMATMIKGEKTVEFKNQSMFARDNQLNQSNVNACIRGLRYQTKGWKFSIVEGK